MKYLFAGAIAFAVLHSVPASAQSSPPPPACTAPEHGQFDFWVGSWDVYPTGKEKLVAHSLIEKLYAGCAVRENWMPLGGPGGGSLSNYVTEDKQWKQTWVDSQNGRVEFTGGFDGNAMVLTGFWKGVNGPGKDGLVRMTYSKDSAGNVRQLGQISVDSGKTWASSFDFTYKPAGEPKK